MEESNPDGINPKAEKSVEGGNPVPKKAIGNLLGIEISAPAGMKNPVLKLTGLILINLLLLILLRMALNN